MPDQLPSNKGTTAIPLDLGRLKIIPLSERSSFIQTDAILVDPDSEPQPLTPELAALGKACAADLQAARARGAASLLIFGAHLVKNGAALLLDRLMAGGFLNHLATNGAGSIHDWEFAWHGATSEGVQANVATGTFGVWAETSTNIHLALMAGSLSGTGYGQSLGQFIENDGARVPTLLELERLIVDSPAHPLTSARADLLHAVRQGHVDTGHTQVVHRWKHASLFASAYRHGIPLTVHPGIGYDVISNHPIFSGSVIGRAGEWDFRLLGSTVERLEGGVVLSVGSAVMGPQVFEKSLSCVNNLRLQQGGQAVAGHSFYVVDIHHGGRWDWSRGEPPPSHPAYYLRFCKSYSRMGGAMHYLQCDNVVFLHHLLRALTSP